MFGLKKLELIIQKKIVGNNWCYAFLVNSELLLGIRWWLLRSHHLIQPYNPRFMENSLFCWALGRSGKRHYRGGMQSYSSWCFSFYASEWWRVLQLGYEAEWERDKMEIRSYLCFLINSHVGLLLWSRAQAIRSQRSFPDHCGGRDLACFTAKNLHQFLHQRGLTITYMRIQPSHN